MVLHLADAVRQGYKHIAIRTVDTDVVVLAVAAGAELSIPKIWIAFGTAKSFRYISVHEIITCLGPLKSEALPFFHAYTGCDTVSSFYTRGKRTAWETWRLCEEVTDTFLALSKGPDDLSDNHFKMLEKFTIYLYDRTSNAETIDEARQELFTKKGRAMDAIPPTRAALEQHVRRAIYQGGFCWGKSLHAIMDLPSPEKWGWWDPANWKPFWTKLLEVSTSARELVRCGCRKGCVSRCKCIKAALPCTALCACNGVNCDV